MLRGQGEPSARGLGGGRPGGLTVVCGTPRNMFGTRENCSLAWAAHAPIWHAMKALAARLSSPPCCGDRGARRQARSGAVVTLSLPQAPLHTLCPVHLGGGVPCCDWGLGRGAGPQLGSSKASLLLVGDTEAQHPSVCGALEGGQSLGLHQLPPPWLSWRGGRGG